MKTLLKLITSIIFLNILFVSLLFLSNLIPKERIQDNLKPSIDFLIAEGDYSTYGVSWRRIIRDSFTDSIMLNIAYSANPKKPLKTAMQSYYSNPSVASDSHTSGLESLYHGREATLVSYNRYWHGYLVYLRPLLVFLNYGQIRLLLTLALFASSALTIFLIYQKLGLKFLIPFILGLLLIDFFYVGQSIQFISVFLIAFIASIYILLNFKAIKFNSLLFFIVGALTSYLDLLTAPIISLGIPLSILIYKKDRKYLYLVSAGINWALGYLSLWFSKWFLVQILYGTHSVKAAFRQIGVRTLEPVDSNFSQWKTISLNFWQMVGYDKTNKIILLSLAIIMVLLLMLYFRKPKRILSQNLPWLLFSLVPYAWYAVAANHSYMHVWYSYRAQYMSIFSAVMIYTNFINFSAIKKDLLTLISWLRSKKATIHSHFD